MGVYVGKKAGGVLPGISLYEDYVSVTAVVGAAFGREPSVAALFAAKARSYGCHAHM